MSKNLPFHLFIRQALLYPLTSPFLPPVSKVEEAYSYAAGKRIGTLEIPAARGIPKTGQTTSLRTGDDGNLEIGYPLTGPRFTDNGNGTITDNATGLMWVKQPENIGGVWESGGQPTLRTWPQYIDDCLALNYGGHNDWRLPNIHEAWSLVQYETNNPCIDLTFFPNTTTGEYWSSTGRADSKTNKWYLKYTTPYFHYLYEANTAYARPVRGPV